MLLSASTTAAPHVSSRHPAARSSSCLGVGFRVRVGVRVRVRVRVWVRVGARVRVRVRARVRARVWVRGRVRVTQLLLLICDRKRRRVTRW